MPLPVKQATAVLVLAVGAVLLGAAPASAHGQLAESSPPDGGSVREVLHEVTLYFTEEPNPAASFVVTAPDGTEVQGGWSPGDQKRLREPVQEFFLEDDMFVPRFYDTGYSAVVPLTHLPATGEYTVRYESVASDGDEVVGTLSFTYGGDPTEPAPGVRSSPGGAADPAAVFGQFPPPTGSPEAPVAPGPTATDPAAAAAEPPAVADGHRDPPSRTPLVIGAALVTVLGGYVAVRLSLRRKGATSGSGRARGPAPRR
jgi:methionine-rich copper-binding protein CopC